MSQSETDTTTTDAATGHEITLSFNPANLQRLAHIQRGELTSDGAKEFYDTLHDALDHRSAAALLEESGLKFRVTFDAGYAQAFAQDVQNARPGNISPQTRVVRCKAAHNHVRDHVQQFIASPGTDITDDEANVTRFIYTEAIRQLITDRDPHSLADVISNVQTRVVPDPVTGTPGMGTPSEQETMREKHGDERLWEIANQVTVAGGIRDDRFVMVWTPSPKDKVNSDLAVPATEA